MGPKIANVFALHGGQAEQAGGRYKNDAVVVSAVPSAFLSSSRACADGEGSHKLSRKDREVARPESIWARDDYARSRTSRENRWPYVYSL